MQCRVVRRYVVDGMGRTNMSHGVELLMINVEVRYPILSSERRGNTVEARTWEGAEREVTAWLYK